MENNPVLLILSAGAAHAAGGALSQTTLDRANAGLRADYPGARVWQERLQQKVNAESKRALVTFQGDA